MKKLLNRGMLIAMSLLFLGGAANKSLAQDVSVSYQTFYDNLSPYGQWVDDQQYGNVWVPNEGGDFRPYGSRGHWVMTDYGNTWVSEDPWGWACYHYGRWTYNPYYGWVWVPGYEWAPAWVSWRYGGGYSGWAPLGPGVNVGVSFNCPDSWWIFVQPQYMYGGDCYSHWRGPSYNNTYIRQTTIINNYYMDNGTHVRYNYGPRQDALQRDIHQPIQVYHVSQMRKPGAPVVQNNRVSIYRPAVNQDSRNTARPANVVQAPRQIGRPQAATTVTADRQPEFRQQVQSRQLQQQPGRPQPEATGQPGRAQAQPQNQGRTQVQPQGQPQNQGRTQVQPQGQPQNQGRTQAQPQGQPMNRGRMQAQPQGQPQNQGRTQAQPQGQPMNQGRTQMQPQGQPQNQGRTQVQPQMQPQNRPEPMNRPEQQAQPMNRPQPQMQPQNRPEPMNRPQPQMQPQNRPEPMNRPQPQMQPQNRPEPMNRPQPQAQPQMQQARPQMQAPRQEQERPEPQRGEGGGGRR